mmetsp:Transcript_95880/g.200420  ORF Transcript_95880/g.200420 Transcript_95880/m.200420 type:complete len:430 (-) Transcript_95880:85-1374(-)
MSPRSGSSRNNADSGAAAVSAEVEGPSASRPTMANRADVTLLPPPPTSPHGRGRCHRLATEIVAIVRTCLRKLWASWLLLVAVWFASAIAVTDLMQTVPKKDIATVISNLLGWVLIMPLVMCEGIEPLKHHWFRVLGIAVLTGVEKTTTNLALYDIDASLRTAVQALNVPFTLFLGALYGIDEVAKRCLCNCRCKDYAGRSFAITLTTAGSVIAAYFAQGWRTPGSDRKTGIGIAWELAAVTSKSSRYLATKALLGDAKEQEQVYTAERAKRPSTLQIAFMTNPIIALCSAGFALVRETSWVLPQEFWLQVVAASVGIVIILICQLRLTQLTNALTLAVLSVLKEFATVVFFVVLRGESFTGYQWLGYSMSVSGCLLYACSTGRSSSHVTSVREDNLDSMSQPSAVEEMSFGSFNEGSPRFAESLHLLE